MRENDDHVTRKELFDNSRLLTITDSSVETKVIDLGRKKIWNSLSRSQVAMRIFILKMGVRTIVRNGVHTAPHSVALQPKRDARDRFFLQFGVTAWCLSYFPMEIHEKSDQNVSKVRWNIAWAIYIIVKSYRKFPRLLLVQRTCLRLSPTDVCTIPPKHSTPCCIRMLWMEGNCVCLGHCYWSFPIKAGSRMTSCAANLLYNRRW